MDNKSALLTIASFTQALAILLFIAVLYFAREVFIPIALGALFAFVLSPAVNRIQRLGISNVVAVIITAGIVFSALSAFLFAIWLGLSSITDELPKYRGELKSKVSLVQSAIKGVGGNLAILSEDVAGAVENVDASEETSGSVAHASGETSNPVPSVLERLLGTSTKDKANDGSSPKSPLYVTEATSGRVDVKTWAGSAAAVLGPIGTAGLVTVFAIFGVLYRDDLRDRFTSVISRGNYVVTTEAINEASNRIGKYLVAQVILNVSYGFTFAMGLLVIGYFFAPDGKFPYVLMLGTTAGVVRFLPYIGPLIGAAVPALMSVLMFPGYSVLIAVVVLIVLMELISNNIIEPWLYGSSTGVSPVAVIIAAVFWAWLWGPIGLLLATPLTVCAVVLGQYVPRFKFLAMLLSEDVQVKPSVRGYQRLLSGDDHKFSDFITEQLEEKKTPELLEKVVVPIVKLVLNDDDRHGSSDLVLFERLGNGLVKAGVLPDPAIPSEPESSTEADKEIVEAPPDKRHRVAAIAASHLGEEIVLKAIGHNFRERIRLDVFTSDDLPDRQSADIVERQFDLIVVCVIPPNGAPQARFWCKSLRSAGYRGPIIVSCLGRFRDFDKLFLGFRRRGANWLTTTVPQTCNKIRSVLSKSVKSKAEPPIHVENKPFLELSTQP